MEKTKDRDFIETAEGLFLCVVGYLHPPDSYTAYLKYIPDPGGRWGRGETRYARAIPYYHVSQVEETYALLREKYPQYLLSCPVRGITVSSVPRSWVKTYYHPRRRLNALIAEGAGDALERRLVDLVILLSDLSGLGTEDFGITGSLLTRIHNPEFSDIDLTVHGSMASNRLKSAIVEAREGSGIIERHSRERMETWSLNRSEMFPLNFEELMEIARRRWNYGLFKGTYFSVHPVRADSEIAESYGDRFYRRRTIVTGTAEVTDSSESIFLPAVYRMEDVELDGSACIGVNEVVSYEGLFCDIFEEGERVEFSGVLEEVKGGEGCWRVVIGGADSGGGFIRLAV